jgi:hypothetical protein
MRSHRFVGVRLGCIRLAHVGAFGGAIERFLVPQVLLVRVDDLDARAAVLNSSSSSSEEVISDGSSSLISSYSRSPFPCGW